ncbi:hypothetical protein Tco_1203477 [Tanacetum coccineum]
MASTTIRMVTTKGYEKLQLSYPYDRFERNNRSWDDKKYRARGHPRYHLSDIAKHCKGQDLKMNVIEEKLMSNILGEVGIDVSADDPIDHYVEVKCSWGEKFGNNIFKRVDFDISATVVIVSRPQSGSATNAAVVFSEQSVVYGVCKEKASWPFCKEKENEDVFFGVKTGKVDASGSSREEENLMVHASTVL